MEYDDVVRTTFAAREFTADDVSDDDLYRILETARFAPSGGNRQGAHVVVVRDAETKRALADLSRTGARRYLAQKAAGENPWNPVHPTTVTQSNLDDVRGLDAFVAPIADAPVVLVVTIDLAAVAALDSDLDRIAVVPGGSVYPLVWNILTGARAAGYGGTITTMAVAQEPAVRELLGIPEPHALAAVVPLGRPVKQLTRLRRAEVEAFVTRERFDGSAFGS
ncbi:nitroreductase family protein [Gordonia sp. PDNC005]|uniref:nitroreductase family protein n=1 Tax=unclassified Gordonia (in: high G+C Gram-positive bacteria) TaxID=2657482 RepID=UPI0019659C77|nr:nitroreductase family protein [Gordonia sp. PDNC005]QRY64341.1 nitroreductase family protein [Gordonia sp. PDNC005]